MYMLKHAVQNLGRNKGRNILMAVILYVILLAVAISIVVNFSTTQLIENQKSQFGVPITLVRDYRKIPPTQKYAPMPTAEELMKYTDSDLLMKSQLSTTLPVSVKEWLNSGSEQEDDNNDAAGALLMSSMRKGEPDEFASGLREIVDGHLTEGADQCVISRELAEAAGLKTGDTITLQRNDSNLDIGHEEAGQSSNSNGEDESLTLKIVGIYKNHLRSGDSFEVEAKQIFMDFKALVTSGFYSAGGGIAEAQMILKNPSFLESFTKELQDKGLPEYYNVNGDDSVYKKITTPLEGLKSITTMLTIVVTIFGAAVLLILSILTVRERKYEVGVLRAMGVKKKKVSLMLVSESVLITAVCLILAIGSASVMSNPVGSMLLRTQTVSQDTEAQNSKNDQGDKIMPTGIGFSSLTANSEEQPELNAELDKKSAAEIVLIALLLACAASAASIVFVMRFEPMKILTERN